MAVFDDTEPLTAGHQMKVRTSRIAVAGCLSLLCACSPRPVIAGRDDPASLVSFDAGAVVTPPAAAPPPAMADASMALRTSQPKYDAALPDASVVDASRADTSSMTEPDADVPPVPCTGSNADCDGDPKNGCESNLDDDSAHCGSCSIACKNPDCACRAGKLTVACPTGHANCDGDSRNGCEVDTSSSMQNCGSCGKLCHHNGLDAVDAVCTDGHCHITCRFEPFEPFMQADCDDNPDTGCETDLLTDNQNCGMCGTRCTCLQGKCR